MPGLPNFNFQEDLLKIAERIFIPIIQGNIQARRAIDGSSLPPLEPNTVKIKARKSTFMHPDQPLINTGKLFRGFFARKAGKSKVVMTITPDRKLIGKYLQIDGIRSKVGTKYFNFFGISTLMEEEAVLYMEERIAEEIKNA